MSDERLDEILENAESVNRCHGSCAFFEDFLGSDDIPVLVNEVRRLRRENRLLNLSRGTLVGQD